MCDTTAIYQTVLQSVRKFIRNDCLIGRSNVPSDPPADAQFDEIKFFNRCLSQTKNLNDFYLN
jgi:hypothetical protein